MLNILAYEEIIKQTAVELGLEVPPQDIDDELHYLVATDSSGNTTQSLTDAQFKELYRQKLDETGFSDAEYREIIRIQLLTYYLEQYMAQNLPSVFEQVYLNVIVVANSADAESAKASIEGGESFADVAREVSLDVQTRESGGGYGWVPQGILPYDSTIFELDIGEVSDPVATNPDSPSSGQYVLFMVSEIDPERETDESTKQTIVSNLFDAWLVDKAQYYDIEVVYDFNNTEKQAWVEWQLAK